MSLIPYEHISSIVSFADNTVKALATRSSQNRANQMMRDYQLAAMQTELVKIDTLLRMHAVADLTHTAFDELNRTAAQFSDVCRQNPALAETYYRMLQTEAQIFSDLIRSFDDNCFGGSRRLLP